MLKRCRSIYFDHFKEDFEKVKECKEILDRALEEKRFSEIRENEYYKALERACKKAGEPYMGLILLDTKQHKIGMK